MRYLSLILGFFLSMSAEAGIPIKPYLGVEVNHRSMNFKEGFGRSEFEHTLMGASGLIGCRVEDFALEVGGHITPWSSNGLNEHKISGLFVNFVGYYPLTPNIEIYGGVGMSHLTFSFVRPQKNMSLPAYTDLPPKYSEISDNIANFMGVKKSCFKNFAPRILLGVQTEIVENIHARLGGSFEVTRKLKHYEIRPKNSSSLHSGLVLSF